MPLFHTKLADNEAMKRRWSKVIGGDIASVLLKGAKQDGPLTHLRYAHHSGIMWPMSFINLAYPIVIFLNYTSRSVNSSFFSKFSFIQS